MKRLKNLARKIIVAVQKILIAVFLFLIYFLGFGLTFLFTVIFNRRLLGIEPGQPDTCWVKAEGYQADIQDGLRQS